MIRDDRANRGCIKGKGGVELLSFSEGLALDQARGSRVDRKRRRKGIKIPTKVGYIQ